MCLMRAFAAVLFAAIVSLASAQPAPRGTGGFRNNYPHADKESFWAWKLEQWRDGVAEAASGRLEPAGGQDRSSGAARRPTPTRR